MYLARNKYSLNPCNELCNFLRLRADAHCASWPYKWLMSKRSRSVLKAFEATPHILCLHSETSACCALSKMQSTGVNFAKCQCVI